MKKKRLMHLIRYLLIVALGDRDRVSVDLLLFHFLQSKRRKIYGSLSLLSQAMDLDRYTEGWKSLGQYSFGNYLFNSFLLDGPDHALHAHFKPAGSLRLCAFDFPSKNAVHRYVRADDATQTQCSSFRVISSSPSMKWSIPIFRFGHPGCGDLFVFHLYVRGVFSADCS
jgi:hypothetical protein